MSEKEEMTIDERRKYLKLMKRRYGPAKRQDRSELLGEMEEVTGLHRKSLLRLLHAKTLVRKKRQKQRERSYGPEVERGVLVVWESLDYGCAKRLTPSLLSCAQH